MPNIQSAKKKLRKDIKRTKTNLSYIKSVKKTIKNIGKIKDINKAYSIIDKAAKKKTIHPNKAARLKSQISRLQKKGT